MCSRQRALAGPRPPFGSEMVQNDRLAALVHFAGVWLARGIQPFAPKAKRDSKLYMLRTQPWLQGLWGGGGGCGAGGYGCKGLYTRNVHPNERFGYTALCTGGHANTRIRSPTTSDSGLCTPPPKTPKCHFCRRGKNKSELVRMNLSGS